MGSGVESRFERYAEVMVKALGHADRATPAQWYLRGLMLPGQRKSVEPMAARVHPQDVCSAHQSMHHLVADSDWSDVALLQAVTGKVLPVLTQTDPPPYYWIIDDTGFRKDAAIRSVWRVNTVAWVRREWQVAVSLSFATAEGSLPLAYRLYLPRQWPKTTPGAHEEEVPPEIALRRKAKSPGHTSRQHWRAGSHAASC